MSDIIFDCPKCGKSLAVDSQAMGLTVKCPACFQPIQVPAQRDDGTIESKAPVKERAISGLPTLPDAIPLTTSISSGTNQKQAQSDSVGPAKPFEAITGANGLFTVLRFLALGISLCLIVSILVAGIRLFRVSRKDAYLVSYLDIKQSMSNGAKDYPSSSLKRLERDYQIPDNIARLLADNNRKQMFMGWIEGLDPVQREDFISNLSSVIAEAAVKKDDVTRVMNEYARIKRHKLMLNLFENYSTKATKYALMTFVVFMMGLLLALFTLILVLLSIERNTRKA